MVQSWTKLLQKILHTTVAPPLLLPHNAEGKSILQVPDTGTQVLANTRPFLCSSIVSFGITPARSKGRKYRIFTQ